jgi:hypothetical protein
MTERMPRSVKPFVKKFWNYSNHPLSLGVSDFCSFDENGTSTANANFPFAVILSPCTWNDASTKEESNDVNAFDKFLDESLAIPSGTALFDIFACPCPEAVPDPTKLQRIGRITSTSETILSSPQDGLFFRHQRKEEDYELRPEWKTHLKTKCVLDDGSTGTVSALAGWELFEGHISKGTFLDFEKLAVA